MDALYITIEYSIGLAGFSGIVLAIRSRLPEQNDWERYRVLSLLMYSFLAAGSSFSAVLLANWYSLPLAWQYSSWFVATALVILIVFPILQLIAARSLPRGTAYRSLVVFFFVVAIPSLIVQVLNATGAVPGREFVLMLSGVVFMLFWGSLQFVVLLVRLGRD